MRRDDVDPLGNAEAGRIGRHDEGREAARTGRLAGAGEDDITIGDAAVGNPGLQAVEAILPADMGRRGGHGRDIGTGIGFGQGKGGDGRAGADRRAAGGLLLSRAEQRDRAGAEALHGEGEIGEAVDIAERRAGDAEGAHVERSAQAALVAGHAGGQEPGLAERADETPAGAVDIVMVDERRHGLARPGGKAASEGAVFVVKERQAEKIGTEHVSSLPRCCGNRRHAARAGWPARIMSRWP